MAEANAEDDDRGPAQAQGVARDLTRESWRRPWYSQLIAYLLWVLVTVPAVWLCDWLLSGFHTGRPWGPLVFAAVMGVVGLSFSPSSSVPPSGWAGSVSSS